ncbi:MAG: hypothetical protein R2879_22030 [Saprospiraceae bacterium]|jgi:hypothetical protein
MLKDEKDEKKEIQAKFDHLQKEHMEKIEAFGNERIRYVKKYDRLLIFIWVLVVMAIFLVLLFRFSDFSGL